MTIQALLFHFLISFYFFYFFLFVIYFLIFQFCFFFSFCFLFFSRLLSLFVCLILSLHEIKVIKQLSMISLPKSSTYKSTCGIDTYILRTSFSNIITKLNQWFDSPMARYSSSIISQFPAGFLSNLNRQIGQSNWISKKEKAYWDQFIRGSKMARE